MGSEATGERTEAAWFARRNRGFASDLAIREPHRARIPAPAAQENENRFPVLFLAFHAHGALTNRTKSWQTKKIILSEFALISASSAGNAPERISIEQPWWETVERIKVLIQQSLTPDYETVPSYGPESSPCGRHRYWVHKISNFGRKRQHSGVLFLAHTQRWRPNDFARMEYR